jgi:hypothetical protein
MTFASTKHDSLSLTRTSVHILTHATFLYLHSNNAAPLHTRKITSILTRAEIATARSEILLRQESVIRE